MNLNKSDQVIKKLTPTGYKSLFSTEQANRIFSLPFLKSTKIVRSRSQYGMMLRESRKLSLLYGNLSKKYLQKIFKKSCVEPSKKKESIFSILESRLDVILYRASFFETIPAARQVIIVGGIEVNKKKVTSPGYIVLPGDVVEVLEKKESSLLYQKHCISKICKLKKKKAFLKDSNENMPSLLSLKKLCFKEKAIGVLSDERREKKIKSRFQQVMLLYRKIKLQKTDILINEITEVLNRFKIKTKSQVMATGDESFPHMHVPTQLQIDSVEDSKKKKDIKLKDNLKEYFLANQLKQEDTSCFLNKGNSVVPTTQFTGHNYLSKQNCTILSQFNKENLLNDLAFLENRKSSKFLLKSDFCSNKKGVKKKKDSIEKYNFTLSNNFIFSNYKLKLEKQLFSPLLRNDCFYKQKKQLFFKEQIFSESKKTKPLHLEISFRSLSLIFLFPPQRVCFPTFINLSLIYK